jgi:hypothetical protein
MNILVSFNEIKDIISKKTNNKVQLDFSYVNNSTVKVSYKPVAFLPAVGINVKIEEADNSQIVLSYSTNNAIDMAIRGLAAFLDNHIPKEIILLNTDSQKVYVNLSEIEQLQKPLEMVEIIDVYFENNGLACVLDISNI